MRKDRSVSPHRLARRLRLHEKRIKSRYPSAPRAPSLPLIGRELLQILGRRLADRGQHAGSEALRDGSVALLLVLRKRWVT